MSSNYPVPLCVLFRFKKTNQKNEVVWDDVTAELNAAFPSRTPKIKQQVHDKHDHIARAARKHNLYLCRNNGTGGGSGNGRYVVEKIAPKWFVELRDAGELEGPLGTEANVMHGGAPSTEHILTSITDALDGDEEAIQEVLDLTEGMEPVASRDPPGGGSGKRSATSHESLKGKTPNGRPTKAATLAREISQQTTDMNQSSKQNAEMLAAAITAAGREQLELGKQHVQLGEKTHKMQKREGRLNRKAFMFGFQMLATALNPDVCVAMPDLGDDDDDSE